MKNYLALDRQVQNMKTKQDVKNAYELINTCFEMGDISQHQNDTLMRQIGRYAVINNIQ